MEVEHLEDRLFDAISAVESALSSLGGVELEYMTSDEYADTLDVLQLMTATLDNITRTVDDRVPVTPERAAAMREIEEQVKGYLRDMELRRSATPEASPP
jgi:hypothetical protein